MPEDAPVNTGAATLRWPELWSAERRVLGIQTRLHQWAMADAHRRFHDLFNLVTDPAFLMVAWARVRANKGARSAGVDGQTAYYVEANATKTPNKMIKVVVPSRSDVDHVRS